MKGYTKMKYFAFVIGLFAICTIAVAQENEMLQTELEEAYYQKLIEIQQIEK